MTAGLKTLLVVCVLALSFANVVMSSAGSVDSSVTTGSYQPGVRVGEWWQSSIRLCSTVCPIFQPVVWQNSSVVKVAGANVTLQNAIVFPNRTRVTTTLVQNVETGLLGIPYYLTAANLTDGEHLYNSTDSLMITGNQTMMVLGAQRNVTQALHFITVGSFSYGAYDVWDRLTGIMISGQLVMYGENTTVTLTATNIWSPTPDFSVSLLPSSLTMPSNGTMYTVFILIGSVYRFGGNVTLQAVSNSTFFHADLQSSVVKVPSGFSVYADMNVSSTTVGDYSVNVTGTSGSLSHSVLLTAFVRPPSIGSFTLTTSQHFLTMLPGNSTTINVSVTSVDNFSGPVSLYARLFNDHGLNGINDPFGPQAFMNTTMLTVSMNQTETAVLTVETPNFPESGNFTIEVDAYGGLPGIDQNFNISLTVLSPDFTLKASASVLTIPPDGVANATITVRDYGVFGTLRLTPYVYPTGLDCVLSVVNMPMPPGAFSIGNSTLTCLGPPGEYTVTIVAIGYMISHSVTVTILSDDFAMTASPSALSVSSGATGNSTVTVRSYGLSGVVDLSLSASSAGANCMLNESKVLVAESAPIGNVTLSCSGSPGTYTVTITGTSGRLSHSSTVTVKVENTAQPSTSSGFSLFGLPMVESYEVIAAIVLVVLVLVGIGVYSARKKPAAQSSNTSIST